MVMACWVVEGLKVRGSGFMVCWLVEELSCVLMGLSMGVIGFVRIVPCPGLVIKILAHVSREHFLHSTRLRLGLVRLMDKILHYLKDTKL